MPPRFSVSLAQVNYRYGDNVFMPYAVGLVQAYAQQFPEINEAFAFQPPLFLREDPRKVLAAMGKPSIVGLSCYLWNEQYNLDLAAMVKRAFPECLIVFGGTQVPNESVEFFARHPYVDLLVHGEGEIIFTEILREFLSPRPDYTKISGLSVRIEGNQAFKTPPAGRIKDLSQLPSPYLSGIFDFMLGRGWVLNASQETDRGCPYSCTFCDWGGSTFDKIITMKEARIMSELEWFGLNRVEYIFNCNANFGIMPRDVDLVRKMIKIKEKCGGYPDKFRMCTAKNSGDRIFEICRLLNDAKMAKGATLSFQSMDPATLEVVRRTNIGIDLFNNLMDRYRQANIPTYSEVIGGMPGETYQSTKAGIDTLLAAQPTTINLYNYPCSALPNSEMSAPAYVAEHGIKTVQMPILLAHSTPDPDSLPEYHRVVVATNVMSTDDWARINLLYWATQAFHCLGLAQCVAIICQKGLGVGYGDFYEQLLEYFADRPETLIGQEIAITKQIIHGSLDGGRLDRVLSDFGNIYWPLEEASALCLISRKEQFCQELQPFVERLAWSSKSLLETTLLDDLLVYQSAIINGPNDVDSTIDLAYDLHGYFSLLPDGWPAKKRNKLTIKVSQSFADDQATWAREVIWYGRKGGRPYHEANVELIEGE